MRPVQHGDVSCAARVLLRVPEQQRLLICQRMIDEAEAAYVYVRENGGLHPLWGNGSLMAAARGRVLADEPSFEDLEYCQCFEMVLQAVVKIRVSRMRN